MIETHAADTEIWGITLPAEGLTEEERYYLSVLPPELPGHGWVCSELDRVWRSLRLNNRRPFSEQPIGAFYSHPAWLMNGIFSAADPASQSHRQAIAACVKEFAPDLVGDFGGGFGELARRMSEAVPQAKVKIVEPFPSAVARMRLSRFPHVYFVADVKDEWYDVVVAQDVLEHVEDPLDLAIQIVQSVRPGGHAIFANNFNAIIECHLPRTFHLRHTFPYVMRALGLAFVGCVDGAPHAQIFQVPDELHVDRARRGGRLSKGAGRCINVTSKIRSELRRTLFQPHTGARDPR